MTRFSFWLDIVLLSSLVFAGCGSATQPQQAPAAIKIGGGFALTGDEAALDVPAANGAKLAVKEINAAGGVMGKPLDLIVRDSEYKMDVTRTIAHQLVDADKVAVLVGFTDTDSVLAAGPVAQAAGIVFVTPGATSPKLPSQIGDKLFLASFGDNVQAAVGAEYAFKNFGKNGYLIWDDGVEYTTLLARYFNTRFNELGGTLLGLDSYADKATDFAEQIAAIKKLPQEPDFYFVAAMPHNIGLLVKQFREAGLKAPIIGGDGYDTPDLLTQGGAAANDVYYTTHALMDAQNGTAAIQKFMNAYKQEYGHEPENAFAALGYDTMYLLADAMRRAGSTDGAALQKALEATQGFAGTTGSISFSTESHVPKKGVTVIRVHDGKLMLAGEFVPDQVPAP